jgi:ABC-2 type transport system ATP-binding protein
MTADHDTGHRRLESAHAPAPRGTRARHEVQESTNDDAISLTDVVKRYGAVEALAGLTLAVRQGEMFGLIGPDGAGKSTAIRLICGLLHPDAGEVRVFGLDPARHHRRISELVGYLSQRFSLYGDLTIDENIAFFAEIHGVRNYEPRRNRLLDMTQLTPFRGRRADRLSGGMKQKLALACTLVHEPQVIVLDEPTTGVDPVSRREFWKLLSEFLAGGMTIVMSTPYLDEAERCARVALVHEGRVLAADEPERLRTTGGNRIVEIVTSGGLRHAEMVSRLPGVATAHAFGERLHVSLHDMSEQGVARFEAALGATALAGAPVRVVPPSLEDVFIARLSDQEKSRA